MSPAIPVADFPLAMPWQDKLAGAADVFVAKLNADGLRLLYSTYSAAAR